MRCWHLGQGLKSAGDKGGFGFSIATPLTLHFRFSEVFTPYVGWPCQSYMVLLGKGLGLIEGQELGRLKSEIGC